MRSVATAGVDGIWAFQIPMRGSESPTGVMDIAGVGEFQIPMRGSETSTPPMMWSSVMCFRSP